MPRNDNDDDKGTQYPVDLVKWAPYLLAVVSLASMWGKTTTSTDLLKQELSTQQEVIHSLTDKISTLSERMAAIEATLHDIQNRSKQ